MLARMLRAVRSRWQARRRAPDPRQPQASPPAETPAAFCLADAQRIGLRAVQERGWFNEATGELVEGFCITADDTVLDVGCGQGRASLFAARRGARVLAADIDLDTLRGVNRRLAASRARDYLCLASDTLPLPLPDAVATKVVAMEMLEHVDDPARVLAELWRVGKPGAQYLITVPDPLGESVQRAVAPPQCFAKPYHLHVFGRDEFEGLIRASGLSIERRHHGSFFWTVYWILFWADERPINAPGPVLAHWTKTWQTLLETPNAAHVRKALDDCMPKNQAIVARKAA